MLENSEYYEYTDEEIVFKREEEIKVLERESRNSENLEESFDDIKTNLYKELLNIETPVTSTFQSIMNLKSEYQQNLERIIMKTDHVKIQKNLFTEIKKELVSELCSRNHVKKVLKKKRRSARIAGLKHIKYC